MNELTAWKAAALLLGRLRHTVLLAAVPSARAPARYPCSSRSCLTPAGSQAAV